MYLPITPLYEWYSWVPQYLVCVVESKMNDKEKLYLKINVPASKGQWDQEVIDQNESQEEHIAPLTSGI